MKHKDRVKQHGTNDKALIVRYSSFPRPICLEKCTMDRPKGYESDILKTLKAFSNQEYFRQKNPHKLQGFETWSLDVKSRNDVYRMLFKVEDGICKIIDLCTDKTH